MPIGAIGAIAGIASAGVGIAGAAGAFAPDDPRSPDYGAMSKDAQQAQIDLLPQKYAARQTYDPKFAALQRQTQYENLFGTQSGSRQQEYIDYEPQVQRVPTGEQRYNRSTGRMEPVYEETTVYNPVVKNRTVQTEGSPGMLALAKQATPELNQISIDSQAQQTAGNLGRLEKYGPQAFKAIQGFDPFASALSDQLLANAQEELTAGRGLTSSQRRDSEQAIRGAQASRGMGFGPTDVFQEALTLGDRGEQQLNRRQAYASSILGQRNGLYGRAYEALGLSPGQGADASPYLGAAGQPGPDYTNINPAAYQVGLAGYNAQNQASIAGYNQQMGALGGLIGGLGRVGNAYSNMPGQGTPNVGNGYNSYQGNPYSGYPTA